MFGFLTKKPDSYKKKKDYVFLSELGRGGYGVVKLAENKKTKEKVAIKVVPRKILKQVRADHPLSVMLVNLKHPHVIDMIDTFESNKKLYAVLELALGGDLFDHVVNLGYIGEGPSRDIIKAILQGLEYIHDKKIVHRDIKPENIFYRSKPDADPEKGIHDDLLISDFGLMDYFKGGENEKLYAVCGSPGYTAPEIFIKKGYDYKCDMFSLGVVFFIVIVGHFPYHPTEDRKLWLQEVEKPLRFPKAPWRVSDEALDLLHKLVEVDPTKRPSATEALQHPWFSMPTDKLAPRYPDTSHATKPERIETRLERKATTFQYPEPKE